MPKEEPKSVVKEGVNLVKPDADKTVTVPAGSNQFAGQTAPPVEVKKPEFTKDEFTQFFTNEVAPEAKLHGFHAILKPIDGGSKNLFAGPTWRYNPVADKDGTHEGQIFTDSKDVPHGWVANPYVAESEE